MTIDQFSTCDLQRTAHEAARRYAVLQPVIVDKEPLFAEVMRRVEAAGVGVPERVVELGVGSGGFLEAVAAGGGWPGAWLAGCDLSEGQSRVAAGRLAELGRPAHFWGGVNALDETSSFYHEVVPSGSVDVVVLSQFDHYAPDADDSWLAAALRARGRVFTTKSGLRRLARSRLRPGGWLMVIDDFAADSPQLQAEWSRAWDAHVVRALAAPEVLARLAAVDPEWSVRLAHHYAPGRPVTERLALAARARSRRRRRDLEETQSLGAAMTDFATLFDDGAWGVVPHPDQASFPQFFLFWGRVPT